MVVVTLGENPWLFISKREYYAVGDNTNLLDALWD